MSRKNSWLFAEIDRWVAAEIITPAQAQVLRLRYPESVTGNGLPWGLIVFSCVGATVVGLGIILLIAYNWDEIPKAVKLALIFAAVAGAHLGALRLSASGGWKRVVGEALFLLGSLFFGAAIWLVAQVYHIEEHFPDGFLYWGLGVLALTWAMESVTQALLATVLFTIWGCSEGWNFDGPAYWALIPVVVGIGPIVWRTRSAILAAVVLSSVYVLSLTALLNYGGSSRTIAFVFGLAAALLATARLLESSSDDRRSLSAVLSFFGYGSFIVCAYVLSFHRAAGDLLDWTRHPGSDAILSGFAAWAAFGVGVAMWSVVGWFASKKRIPPLSPEQWLCPIGLVYIFLLSLTSSLGNVLFVAVVFNLILLGTALMWMFRGCREARLPSTILGSVLFAALVLARYFDLFESLAARGVAFVLLGGILLVEAIYYHRAREAQSLAKGLSR